MLAWDVAATPSGLRFETEFRPGPTGRPPGRWLVTSPLIGDYNVANILAATGAALALGVPSEAIVQGVGQLRGVIGRMERIDRGQPFTAIVDFAHTPNALAVALQAAAPADR